MTREEKKEIYRSLCTQGKIRALFMQPWWLEASGPWEVALAVRNGQIVGAMPYAMTRRWGLPVISMPAMTHHLQIWMDKPPDISAHKWLTREKQIIWLLIEDLPAFAYFSMVFEEGSFNNWLPFHWKGFRQEMRYTFLIRRDEWMNPDLQPNRNLRRNIRDAGQSVEIHQDIPLESLFRISQQTYQRQQMSTPYTLEHLHTIDQAVRAQQSGLRLGAYDRTGDCVAAAWWLWDADRAYYFIAGDTQAGRDLGAGILICQEALRMAFEERQVSSFDFCGSMLEPVTEVRRQFGASATGLMKIYKSRYKLIDIMMTLRRG